MSKARVNVNKLNEIFPDYVDVRAYGAVCDGVTDDTDAVQAAINYAKTVGNVSRIFIEGTLYYNPAALNINWTSAMQKVTFVVDGTLKPSASIIINDLIDIEGVGGGTFSRFVQFTMGATCDIIPPPGNVPTIIVRGAGTHSIRNVSITGAYQGIYLDGATGLGALARFDNVNIYASAVGGTALVIDAFFWTFFNQCRFLANDTGNKSILITNTSTTYSQAGLSYFKECITAGKGISVNPSVGACGNIYFYDHHHENLSAGEDFFFAQSGSYNITFNQVGLSDSLPGAGFTFDVNGVSQFNFFNSYPQSFKTFPKSGFINADTPYNYINVTRELSTVKGEVNAFTRGAISGRLLSRGHSSMLSPGLGTPKTVNVTAGTFDGGNIQVTAGQIAPDGSATAYKVEAIGAGASTAQFGYNVYQATVTLSANDCVILFGMCKSLDTTTGINSDKGAINLAFINGDLEILTFDGRSSFEAAPIGLDHALADDGWMAFASAFRCKTGATKDLAVSLIMRKASAGFLIWKPNIRIIPASYGMTNSDIQKYIQAFGPMHTANAGVMSILEHQTLRTGLNTTANRPLASAVGVGAQFFDITLNKPIWSDGTNWRDAAGTIV